MLFTALESARAEDSATFGGEPTFTNPKIIAAWQKTRVIETPELLKAQSLMAEKTKLYCLTAGCTVVERRHKGSRSYRVAYPEPDGFYYDITLDYAVIEIVLGKGTTSDFSRNRDRLRDQVFGIAAQSHLVPDAFYGGGHVHVGIQSGFQGNVLLFRNFVVDFYNHPSLATAVFADEHDVSAVTLTSLPVEARMRFAAFIAEFDKDFREGRPWTIREFALRMTRDVYQPEVDAGRVSSVRNFALNLENVLYQPLWRQTLEIRSMRSHRTADAFLAVIELLESRRVYLRDYSHEPLPFLNPGPTTDRAGIVLELTSYGRGPCTDWWRTMGVAQP